MPYVAIPSQLKNVDSISLQLMSPEEMSEMSYGEVLTAETINYRTGLPQMNGLFCQAIFGPTKDWECACGKYKRYRYAGVICDKCGVEVTHSSVRRERMGHISLAAPCLHPWFLRVIPSRVALMLNMKSSDVSRVAYFSAYVITEINEEMREDYINKIETESQSRIKQTKADFDLKFEELSKQYQVDKSSGKFEIENLKEKYEADKDILKIQQSETVARIETIAEVAKKELISLKFKDVITEVLYQELSQKFGPVFRAQIGAEAIQILLSQIDLQEEYDKLKEELITAKTQARKKISKRLKLIRNFLKTNSKPQWMVLSRVMVLPPDLRPMLQLDGGRFAASDLNELYRRLINRNNRLRKLIRIGAPEVILRNEKRMLQESVEALIDNASRGGRQVMASSGAKRPLKSLSDVLKGKQGRFRQNLLGKRVDYSGRSVVIVGPNLKLEECGLPKQMALELFKPFLIGRLISKSEQGLLPEDIQCFNVHSARRLIDAKHVIIYDILDEVIKDKYVLLNRAPTLHRLGFLAFKPVLTEGKAIKLHPLVCKGFNADFDGDQMAVHLPITLKGQEEARELMSSTKNLIKPADGELITAGDQDFILGAYYLTRITKTTDSKKMKSFGSELQLISAFNHKVVELGELVRVRLAKKNSHEVIETTVGRVIYNEAFPADFEYINETINKKNYKSILDRAFHAIGQDRTAKILDIVKDNMFKYATNSGISLSIDDFQKPIGKKEVIYEARDKIAYIQSMFEERGLMTEQERYIQIVSLWRSVSESILSMCQEALDGDSNTGLIMHSGARGNDSQLNMIVGIRGLSVDAGGRIIELPALHGYIEGLTGLEFFIGMKGQRKGQADLVLKTADAGYLTRRLVDVAQNIIIMGDDCGTREGILINEQNSKLVGKDIYDRVYGRYLLRDIEIDGEIVAKKDEVLDKKALSKLQELGQKVFYVRTVTKCELTRGACKKCYGLSFATHQPPKEGEAVGIIAAQSIGEPSTQLTISSKHTLGVVQKSDITTGLPRVEEIFEGRIPKYSAPIAQFNGKVAKVSGSIDTGFEITLEADKKAMTLPYIPEVQTLLVEAGSTVKPTDSLIIKKSGELVTAGASGSVEVGMNEIVINQEAIKADTVQTVPGYNLKVRKGDSVVKGQALVEGSLNLDELAVVAGVDAVQEYIVSELNQIYMANGITVNEKHVELIIKQMLSRVEVIDGGDSEYISGDIVSFQVIFAENQKLISEDKKPAIFKRTVTGISRASLSTESFLSAASFQETSRVLVEAVLSGRVDHLLGLKENVILGQLIPAGTGYDPDKVATAEIQEDLGEE